MPEHIYLFAFTGISFYRIFIFLRKLYVAFYLKVLYDFH